MNVYIWWRIEKFTNYYNSISKEKQIWMLRDYFWQDIKHKVLWVLSWRRYCEVLAWFLIEEWIIKIWVYSFEKLVDEIEDFFQKRKTKIYPTWERNFLAFLIKKSRQNR